MDSKELELIMGDINEIDRKISELESEISIIENKDKIRSKAGSGLFVVCILISILYIIDLKYFHNYTNNLEKIFLSSCVINFSGQIVNAIIFVKNIRKYKKLSNELNENLELLATKENYLDKLMDRIKTKNIENNDKVKNIEYSADINIQNTKGKTRIRKRDN